MALMTPERARSIENDLKERKRAICLLDDVTLKGADELRAMMMDLAQASSEEITLLIDSRGGMAIAGTRLYDFIRLLGVPVRGIVLGTCQSAALTVLQACATRHAVPHATFLAHNPLLAFPATALVGRWRDKVDDYVADAVRHQQWAIRMFITRTGMSRKHVRAMLDRGSRTDYHMDVSEAIEKGLLDSVLPEAESLFG